MCGKWETEKHSDVHDLCPEDSVRHCGSLSEPQVWTHWEAVGENFQDEAVSVESPPYRALTSLPSVCVCVSQDEVIGVEYDIIIGSLFPRPTFYIVQVECWLLWGRVAPAGADLLCPSPFTGLSGQNTSNGSYARPVWFIVKLWAPVWLIVKLWGPCCQA